MCSLLQGVLRQMADVVKTPVQMTLLLATEVIRIYANRLFDHVDYQKAKDIVIGQTIKNFEGTPDSQAARDESMFCAFPLDGDNSALDESGYGPMVTQES